MKTTFEQAREQFTSGLAHREAGRLAEAEACFVASLALLPGRPSSLVNLGAVRVALGRPQAAIDDLLAALQAEPDDAIAWNHLGAARLELGQADAALEAFERAGQLGADAAPLRYHRARAHAVAGRPQAAWEALQPLLQAHGAAHDVATAPAWQLAGQLLQTLERHDEAGGHYERALALDPRRGRCWLLLGQLRQLQGRPAEALQAFEHARTAGEDADLLRYLGAAGQAGAAVPPVSPQAYVRGLFDPYAAGFDEHLVQTLRYRGHTAVAAAATPDAGSGWRRALDLGCGTGLCGAAVRAHCEHLTGVDLSPTMIEQARQRGCYDALHLDDVVQHLQGTPQRHDLVLAADVFIYVGDLAPVLDGVRRVLLPGGRFAFSIERDDDAAAATGYCLRPSLRYAHAPAAIRAWAAAAGLQLEHLQPLVLREDQGRPVDGAVCVLRPAV